MGRSTKLKNESLALAESDFLTKFSERSKKSKLNSKELFPDVRGDFSEYSGFFVRNADDFILKTKSKNRDKQRQEFVKHAFHLYPVPTFMFNAWETPRKRGEYVWNRYGFESIDDYRFWYICIAIGGSFYKEYGHLIFTKKECHIFLNCKHDLSIGEAMIYAIAYAESGNIGKSLRIAKTKFNTYDLTSIEQFWKEVIRFFARLEPESKEQLDDIIDYIHYKRNEDVEFTILHKGHTLESLSKKVEQWHQDLRRLKLIGDQNWEGIPLQDSEYTQKNSYGTLDYWKFTQIKSAKVLQKEGNAMRHCVLGYKNDCIAGNCSIWSLTFNGNNKLTIEVRNREIKQARGLANRLPRPNEVTVVRRWAKDSGLGT